MRVAFFNGLIGFLATLFVGMRVLAMPLGETLGTLAVSFVAGLTCILSTLAAERNSWMKTHVLRGSILTWGFLVALYLGILLALAPQMRDVERLAWLFVPLLMAHGWTIMVFGPIQDRIVRRSQKKSHLTF